MRPVAILGSGPAGLLAAYAVGAVGKPIAVFGTGEKSVISGAQFLHRPIPELTALERDFTVRFMVDGDAETYRRKVYGPQRPPFVSFEGVKDGQEQPAWSLQSTYDKLWELFGGDSMNKQTLDGKWLEDNADNFSVIISTIPAQVLCHGGHFFNAVDIHVMDNCILTGASQNTIYYDGTRDRSWYRTSMINSVGSTEWGVQGKGTSFPPFDVRQVSKPISSNCTCRPEIIRVGRYGEWKKGELSHAGFYRTLYELNERGFIDIGPRHGTGDVQMGLL